MPFELGAKKAGLSIVRAFLHSVEGVNPYCLPYPALLPPRSSSATQSLSSTRATRTARWSQPEVHRPPLSHQQP